jgi:hypothetical protein
MNTPVRYDKEKTNQVIMRINFLEENFKKKCEEIKDLNCYIDTLEAELKRNKKSKI